MSLAYNNRNQTEEIEEVHDYPFAVAVRFKDAAKPYSFGSYDSGIKKGDWVVVETQQGLEMGQAEADALSVEKYSLHMPQKPVIRLATDRDMRDYHDNVDYETEAFRVCQREIEELGLGMNLLNAQYTLDRSKILFVYLADQRVDFRELLKRLGARLHCRIELRQIGERDKAKMVGGIGVCGMECCCRRFKTKFDVISINMAKNQMLALNTEKLSGMCGKLMCCLKYEDSDYKQVIEGLPKMGSQVEYEGSIYRITAMNVMNEEAKLENHEEVIFLTLDELKEKAIPRKGIVMQRKNPDEEKKIVKKTVSNHTPTVQEASPHVSMELPSVAENSNTERRRFNGNKRNNNNNSSNRSNYNNNNGRRNNQNNNTRRAASNNQPSAETKNITVRTFGRKKKEEEAK